MNTGQTKYKTARKMSGLTQETAAEKLYTSITTLKCIEKGERRCSSEMAVAMAELYNAPWVADPTLPKNYTPMPRTEATLRYIKESNDVNKVMERATEILADGIVDDSEEKDAAAIALEIAEQSKAGIDLLYAIGYKPKEKDALQSA